MKRTITMWGLFNPQKKLVTVWDKKRDAINSFGVDGEAVIAYIDGYRVRKVKISWEE